MVFLLTSLRLQVASSTCQTGRSEEPRLQLYAAEASLGDLCKAPLGPPGGSDLGIWRGWKALLGASGAGPLQVRTLLGTVGWGSG